MEMGKSVPASDEPDWAAMSPICVMPARACYAEDACTCVVPM